MVLTPAENLFDISKNKHLLLDTSFFGDYKTYPDEFGKLHNELKDKSVTLITLDCVRVEYAKGATTSEEFNTRLLFVNAVVDKVLSGDFLSKTKNVNSVIEDRYLKKLPPQKRKGTLEGASYADLLLAATLYTFRNHIYLISKNYNHLPFSIISHITLYKENKIESFAIYTI